MRLRYGWMDGESEFPREYGTWFSAAGFSGGGRFSCVITTSKQMERPSRWFGTEDSYLSYTVVPEG